MQVERVDGTADVAVLEGYPGLVLRMPASMVVENTTAIREAALAAWGRRGSPKSLVLDMSGTRQLDSSGVGLLLELSHKAEEGKIPMTLCGLRSGPKRMLDRTGIISRFTLCDSLEAAAVAGSATGGDRSIAAMPKRRSRRALWVFDGVLALAIICGAVYLFWQLGAYRGQLDQLQQLTPMQRLVTSVSRRLDAAEDIWRNWGHEKDALLQRFEKGEDNSRRHAENLVAASEQHIKSELEQRTGELQGRMDRIEATQQANSERMSALEQQMDRLKPGAAAANNPDTEPSANRMEPAGPPAGATHADIDDLNRHLNQVEQQTAQTQHDLEGMRSKLDRRRVEFEMTLNHARELAPGISLVVNATNVRQQKFDGRIWLAQEKQSVVIRGQGPQQPLVFYSNKDDVAHELVVTKVTANSVSGYLLLPAAASDGGGE